MNFVIAILFSFAAFARATDLPGLPTILLQKSIRSVGMGGAGTALGDDPGGVYANPAALPFLPYSSVQIGIINHTPDVPGLSTLVMSRPNPRQSNAWAISGSFLRIKSEGFDRFGNATSDPSDVNYSAGISYAHRLSRRIAAGITGQYAAQRLNGEGVNGLPTSSARTGLITGGLIATDESNRFSAGVLAYNLGGEIDYGNGASAAAPSGFKAGLSGRFLPNKELVLGADIDQPRYSRGTALMIGAEYAILQHLALRTGFNFRRGDTSVLINPAFGLGFKFRRVLFDFASAFDPSGLGSSVSAGVGWRFDIREQKTDSIRKIISRENGRINLAVIEFRSNGVPNEMAVAASTFLRTALVNIGHFNVVERENIEKVFVEMRLQSATCADEKCAARIGQIAGAEKMIFGTLYVLKGEIYLSANVVDVASGLIEASRNTNIDPNLDLKSAMQALGQDISEAYR